MAKRTTTGFTEGATPARVRVEFVKRRRVLRVVGWDETDRAKVEPLELPLDGLLDRLGIPAEQLGLPSRYLLFGGSQQDAVGGLRSLLGVFSSEAEGREAFRRLRLTPRSEPGWGELVVLSPSGRPKPVCWFGLPSQVVAVHPAGSSRLTEASGTTTDVPGVSRRRTLRRRLAGPSTVGLRGADASP
jgi:hypothetical protein